MTIPPFPSRGEVGHMAERDAPAEARRVPEPAFGLAPRCMGGLDCLCAGWAALEAALPKGWAVSDLVLTDAGEWRATASPIDGTDPTPRFLDAYAVTPVASLRALEAVLRERQP